MKKTLHLTMVLTFAAVFVLLAVGTLSATTMTGTTEQQRAAVIAGTTNETAQVAIATAANEMMKMDAAQQVQAKSDQQANDKMITVLGKYDAAGRSMLAMAMETRTNYAYFIMKALYRTTTIDRHQSATAVYVLNGAYLRHVTGSL